MLGKPGLVLILSALLGHIGLRWRERHRWAG